MELKFRKKPLVIEAFQMTEERRTNNADWPNWLHEAWMLDREAPGSLYPTEEGTGDGRLSIGTLEGQHLVSWGDWIIQGVHGELYPCKPDIFAKTYEPAEASPASVPEGFTMSEPTLLPDGSGFGTMSFPLPKDHWIYKEREYEDGAIEPNDLPAPVLTHSFRRQVIAAIRYAIRSATNCGKEDDFDPDALVQNAVYALCGPYGKAAPTRQYQRAWTRL